MYYSGGGYFFDVGGIGALPVVLLVDDKDMQSAKSFLSERDSAQEDAGALQEDAGN